jgi:hypothetical protein
MKIEYIKPEITVLAYMEENPLLVNTKVDVNISGPGFDPITGPITEVEEGEEGEPSGAKGYDDVWVEDEE